MNKLRRYRLDLIPVALCTLAVVSATPLIAQASTQNPTASSVLKATQAVVAKETSVHVLHLSKSGSATTSIVADVTKNTGSETISSGSKHVTIIVTPTYVYLSGDSTGLTSLMGLTAAQQKKVGSRSISMKAGTTPYSDLAASATISLVDAVMPAAKGTTVSTQKIDNKKYYDLKWTIKATSTAPNATSLMTISFGGSALPVKETITASTGVATTTFSKWGERVTPVAPSPSSTVTYAKVFG
jgi:hypothetical protein